MSSDFTRSENMRRRAVDLVTEEEAGEGQQFSGDYAPEGPMDHLRRAELWLPTRVHALLILTDQIHWYALALHVGIVPPGTARVSSAEIHLTFEPPVIALGAWEPNDRFAIYRETRTRAGLDVKGDLKLPEAAVAALPGISELLPQLSAEYHKASQAIVVPHDSVIRTMSDGERRLAWQLFEDPQTNIDPRQLAAKIVIGLSPELARTKPHSMATLQVECRCGNLRMRSAVRQSIEVSFG
jgi:hypothetical protein